MDTTGKDGATRDPEEDHRAPQRTLQCTEDRAETGDVQKLYEKQLPLWHDDVIDAIIDSYGRRFTIIRAKGTVDQFTIGKVTDNQSD